MLNASDSSIDNDEISDADDEHKDAEDMEDADETEYVSENILESSSAVVNEPESKRLESNRRVYSLAERLVRPVVTVCEPELEPGALDAGFEPQNTADNVCSDVDGPNVKLI